MEDVERRRKRRDPWRLMGRATVSFVCVCFAQFALYLVSSFFFSYNIIILLFLSVMVLLGIAGLGRRCKRLFGLYGSAPAFVFANLLFIWCVYVVVIRQVVSSLLDMVVHAELIMLLFGLHRILSGDPGFVNCEHPCHEKPGPLSNSETYLEGMGPPTSDLYEGCPLDKCSLLLQRVRYCKHCDAHVKGFDHHCPAFGNCIGQNNHLLFMVLLAGFIIIEACYIVGASQIATTSRTLDTSGGKVGWTETLATSTMIFSLLQVLWQAVFLAWHIYCVCFNIRTDEWIHWKKYPEFQHIIQPEPGEAVTVTRFKNPYDKGIWQNLKEFIEARG
ncbi:probable palmitoyltransferase ZDHHC12 isoform X2 [Cynara cardunculus var. scolymus]|uniref:S-acyltransferase n=1 Tax=Cynara cardunculus var. scolymus TaxID=59895 RepID=A0A103YML6_CYNCS|nr:probable palmitoyltransferase ZDHHC12 isoform X2 [Cynara cardunculus var. scolymus]KVI11960.1 Zinc finger, DHHC-type, palmitoyltransferase [Cynara cardunculus var. scolymus]